MKRLSGLIIFLLFSIPALAAAGMEDIVPKDLDAKSP
jgi:hypothetical protein